MLYRKFTMPATKTQEPATIFRIPGPNQFFRIGSHPARAGDGISPIFAVSKRPGVLNRSGKKVRLAGTDASPDDGGELRVLADFMECHVQKNRICDVQCMLLWNEWVRSFRSRGLGFPERIRENEFRHAVTNTFGVEIANYGSRGPVYPGIKFVR